MECCYSVDCNKMAHMEPRAFSASDFAFLGKEISGGMSKIRKANLVSTGIPYALKFSQTEGEAESTVSFEREVKALLDMDHRGIVRLLGTGTDGTDRFLVLEWLEETLQSRIESLGPTNWQNFYEFTGRPLLDAIRYAHSRGHIHRDLKPLNVMFSRTGIPKVIDFGITRRQDQVRLGITFNQAVSRPWTPQETDDGVFSESRDLYSWAAICVACVTGKLDYQSAHELREAVQKLTEILPASVLLSCLSDTPANRPPAALAMLWELDDYHRRRIDKSEEERVVGIELTPNALQKLEELSSASSLGIEKCIQEFLHDFRAPCQVYGLADGDLEFTGQTYCIKTGRVSAGSPWLLVKDVWPAAQRPASAQGFKAAIRFEERISAKADPAVSRTSLDFLESFLDEYAEREKQAQKRRDEERYLHMLEDVIAARMRALRNLPAVEYADGKWEQGEYSVVVNGEMLPVVGEKRIVRGTSGFLVFQVASFSSGRVFLRSVGFRRGQPPSSGMLQADTAAQRRALDHQARAVSDLSDELAVSPTLKGIVLKPELADPPESSGRPPDPELSADKADVLNAALGLRELMVVQGPPGTGKTKLITAIISRYLYENPSARVLVAAQTHIAIDHVVEKLISIDKPQGSVVRIARSDEEKVALNVRSTLLQNCLVQWCEAAAKKSREFMKVHGEKSGFDAEEVALSIRLQALLYACEEQARNSKRLAQLEESVVQAQTDAIQSPAPGTLEVETATTATLTLGDLQAKDKDLTEVILNLRSELHDLSADGASLADSTIEELKDWTGLLGRTDSKWLEFRKQLELQISWLDLLGQLKQFEEVVLESASVVAGTCVGLASSEAFQSTRFDFCIIDEASKATATEALIPMVRSARTLIVGDPKQLPPFDYDVQVDGYSDIEVKETLLDYLLPKLPKACVYELTHQHRMCESIGSLISRAFYDRKLVNQRSDTERAKWLRKRFAKPVLWMDTKGAKDSPSGHSFVNRREQDIVLDLLSQLQYDAGRSKARASVAVIAGYAAQAQALDRRIGRGTLSALDIEVATVDSFQGRESDICIFSATLSNPRLYLGFLRSIKRLNVALSRPRDLLIIVGDQQFCYSVQGENPFPRVIDYMDEHPDTCETRNASQ